MWERAILFMFVKDHNVFLYYLRFFESVIEKKSSEVDTQLLFVIDIVL